VRAVARVGGRFVLSPVFDAEVVDEAHRLGLLAVPGTSTPTEILAAHRHGARLVKVFPAACLGGAAYIRAVRGPLPGIPLVPTNGITADTIVEYVEAGAVAVGVGAEVFSKDFTVDHIEDAARRTRHAMDSARAHTHAL
jgi:2-dehydro-3-deoxyphosphogluconate aldolase/(4S)-4-hydroxy-2-oxoglutarate aldolase